jgi:uncharacterized membrane protein
VDEARGLALWAMAAFHLTWDLAYFGWIAPEIARSAAFHRLGDAIAASFLLLVGLSLVLARKARGPLLRSRAFWRRWANLIASATTISAASFWLFPQAPIFFGILHCIALASLIAGPLAGAPAWLSLALGALALAAPELFSAALFDAPIFWWTGLGTFEPPSNDFRPILPWLSFVLFGVALARAFHAPHPFFDELRGVEDTRDCAPRKDGPLTKALALCGRHSLAFYLIHQPLLFGLFSLLAFVVVSPGHERLFIDQCADQCFRETREPDACRRTCACAVSRAKARGLWTAMARDTLNDDQKARAHEDILACFGAESQRSP